MKKRFLILLLLAVMLCLSLQAAAQKAEKTEMFIVEEETVEFLDFADEETEVNLDGEE